MENTKNENSKKFEPKVLLKRAWNLVHPADVTWLTGKDTMKRTGVVLGITAVSSAMMMLADTALAALLKAVI